MQVTLITPLNWWYYYMYTCCWNCSYFDRMYFCMTWRLFHLKLILNWSNPSLRLGLSLLLFCSFSCHFLYIQMDVLCLLCKYYCKCGRFILSFHVQVFKFLVEFKCSTHCKLSFFTMGSFFYFCLQFEKYNCCLGIVIPPPHPPIFLNSVIQFCFVISVMCYFVTWPENIVISGYCFCYLFFSGLYACFDLIPILNCRGLEKLSSACIYV